MICCDLRESQFDSNHFGLNNHDTHVPQCSFIFECNFHYIILSTIDKRLWALSTDWLLLVWLDRDCLVRQEALFLVDTWYHFINPHPLRPPNAWEQTGPSGRSLWTPGLLLKARKSCPTLEPPWWLYQYCDPFDPVPPPLHTAAGPHHYFVVRSKDRSKSIGIREKKQQKVNWWSEDFYWDWEGVGGRIC